MNKLEIEFTDKTKAAIEKVKRDFNLKSDKEAIELLLTDRLESLGYLELNS